MKIAIILSGHLRSFRKTHSSFLQFKNTLEQFGTVDVFCHTWDIEESVTASWWKDHKADNPPPATVNTQEIIDTYHPTKLIIEPTVHFDDSAYKINATIPVAGILSMLHTQFRAYELLEQYEEQNNFRYDVLIKTRFDLLYELAPQFNDCVKECINLNCVYLPSSNPYEVAGASSDVFAVGSRLEMGKYFSFCNNFKLALDVYFSKGFRHLTPELCMTVYLQYIGVNKMELTGMRLHILRMNNEKLQINSDRNFSLNLPQVFFKKTIDANLQILPHDKNIIAKNSATLVEKYLNWLNNRTDNDTLGKYAEFYKGGWIGLKLILKLIKSARNSNVFDPAVMRNFFEQSIHNATYSSNKKILLAFVLLLRGNYGFFFFRVWKYITFTKHQ